MESLKVYSRQGCHLCEVLIEELLPLLRGVLEIEVRDIDTRPDWQEKYHIRVPVVEFDGELICQYEFDRDAVAGLLDRVSRAGGD